LGVEAVDIDCSEIFVGSVGPNGEDEITEVQNLAKEKLGENLVGLSVSCEVLSAVSQCHAGELAELWPDSLPWRTNLELMEAGSFLDHLFGNGTAEPGYHILCVTSGAENLCTGLSSTTMTNGVNGVIGKFDATSEHWSCTTGEFDLTGEYETITLAGGGLLSVSSL
jgi:hypothetical protein